MKSGLVDLHCHYLPTVDDGASTDDEGIALLRQAHSDGIDRVVLTPHIHLDRYPNVGSLLRKRFAAFQQLARERGIDVELALGAEVRVNDDLFALVERDEVPLYEGIAGRRSMLIEFNHGHLPPGWQNLLRWLIQRGITPVIAHPERNKEVMRHPERVAAMLDEGCLIQVTAAALLGAFGARVESVARILLAKGWCTILASDAHDLRHRPPLLQAGARAASKIVGESKAWDMVTDVPAALAFPHQHVSAAELGSALASS